MIDKLTPRFLDKSSDEKLVQKTSFVDALNIYVDGDFDADSAGVIKSIKGTLKIDTPYLPTASSDNWFCLGHVVDQNTGIVYFFMVAEDSANHGIWAYDHRGVLPTRETKPNNPSAFSGTYTSPVAKSLHRVVTSNHFNFPTKGHIAADIVYSNSNEFSKYDLVGEYPEKDVLLYFTDNKNEPRMVNVYRAYMNFGLPSSDRQEINDFICACPRVPLEPIKFVFENDDSVIVNNFAATPGFQFAYQNVYKDGLESAISPYSDIAFPPSIINRGATQKDNILAHNKCVLTIPAQNQEVQSVRILARYGNGANFVEIDEVENAVADEPIVFDFLNDRVAGGVSTGTTDKTFDNLPRKAESQTVASNRLIYGNYLEGFDNVDCSDVILEPIYAERPLELLDYTFEIQPSIELTGDGNYTPGDVQNKTMGFKVDVDEFADTVEANTSVNVSFSFSPDKNFHVYTTTKENKNGGNGGNHESYHQSKHVGERSLNLPGYNTQTIVGGSAAAAQESAYQSQAKAGAKYLQQTRENYFGNNIGVGFGGVDDAKWKLIQEGPYATEDGANEGVSKPCFYGTSAANPLILKGGTLNFSVEFLVNERISSGAKTILLGVVTGLLKGDDIETIESGLQLTPGLITVKNVKNRHVHNINLGLSDYDKIPVTSDIGSMICGGHAQSAINDVDGLPPQFAFVVNKAEVPFYLEQVPDKPQRFRMCIENVFVNEPDSVVTCVRDLDPYSPWFAITPTTIASADFKSNFVSIWAQHLSPSTRVFKQVSSPFAQGVVRNFSDKFPTVYNTDAGYPVGTGETRPTMTLCFGEFVPAIALNSEEIPQSAMLSHSGGVDGAFKFSLLDGEGGPGGKGSPGDAYDSLGCENYGSIAGQVFLEFDDSAVAKGRHKGYVAYAFTGNPDGVDSGTEHLALRYVSNNALRIELGLPQHAVVDGYVHTSVIQGPLYTGRIIINNITASEEEANIAYVNPAGTSMPTGDFLPTTTMPLVWFSSWTKYGPDTGASNQGPLIIDSSGTTFQNISTNEGNAGAVNFIGNYNGYQVSFPHPIVVGIGEGGTGGFVEGELVSGQLVEDPFGIGIKSVNFERLHSHCELGVSTTNVDSASFSGGNSFKAGATHEFGIVYYDERGRHGYVNPIGSVFVKTLGERDGDLERGAAFIKASNIKHTPPSWAKSYRFAYSKNTSISKFIQYNAGGAFVANSDYEGGSPSEIYVSLNYLQGHPISYANSFGAKGSDGTPVLYSFTPGDRVRVLSYMLSQTANDISRVFPNNVEFEVTGVTQFTETNNPFSYTDPETGVVTTTEAMKGLFLVLKNNIDAYGFRYQDIEQGNDNWGNNAIIEIYSPAREVDAENRLYYEIGDTYPIVYAGVDTNDDGVADDFGYFHKNREVLLTQGDVFFRRHAVNLREFEGEAGFVDLLDPLENEEEEVSSEANFKSYYLESEAATDLFPSRAISIGRPNIVKLDARESRKESSIIHSERDVVEASKVGYSSFNRTVASDLEIDFKAGPVHYLCNHQDSVFFIQNNKCGHIPVDRTLISDASGSQSLIASSKFLGTPRYYAGDAGCDGDPESVVNVDTTAYFVNKSRGKVYKVHPSNGVNIISDASMAGFFREELSDAVSDRKRIIGGYDPVKKEYLLSIVDESTISYTPVAETLDEQIFTPSDVDITLSGGFEFPGGGVVLPGEEDVDEGDIAPAVIRFDWSIPSNLQPPTWQLVYEDGDITAPDVTNILNDLSYWKTSSTGGNVSILLDLALRCTVENPHNLDGSGATYLISFEGASDIITSSSWNFTFDLEDESDFALVRSITLPYQNNQVGNNWHFKRDLTQQEECFIPTPEVDGQGNVFRLTVSQTGLVDNATVTYEDGDVRSFDIPIRFVCRHEQTDGTVDDSFTPFQILDAFVIGNTAQTSCVVSDRIKIEASNFPFKIGSTANDNMSTIRDLTGNISWQASQAYADIGIDIDAGGIVYEYNPCHPVYGIWQLILDGNGDPSSSTDVPFSVIADFFAVGENTPVGPAPSLFHQWVEDVTGTTVDDLTQEQEDALTNGITAALTDLFGAPLSCPNINYTVGLG